MTQPSGKPIHLNLDQLEAEAEPGEAFRFVLKGHEYELSDPREIPWQDLQNVRTPADFARYCMKKEDRQAFLETRLSGRAFNQLFQDYQEHFGLDNLGNGLGSRI